MAFDIIVKNKARKHCIAISDETNRVLQLSNTGDAKLSYEHLAYMWGWFAAVDLAIYHTSQKMEYYTTYWFLKLSESMVGDEAGMAMVKFRGDASLEIYEKVENEIGKPAVYPLLASIAVDYLNDNGYEAKIEVMLEAIQNVK